ncbi:Pol Polyprotein, partial [Phytophthora megakarya]
MARWLSFFAEYNFEVKYKLTAYAQDDTCVALLPALGSEEFKNSDKELSKRLRAQLQRYTLDNGLLYYSTDPEDTPREVVPHDDDLKYRILYEVHDTPVGGHLGRENTYGSSISMDFVFGLSKDKTGNTGIVVFIDRLSMMVHLSAVPDTVDGEDTAKLFLDRVLGKKLDMSTADHPQTDGQTERVNRVVEDILRSVCAEAPRRWSEMLPLVEFAINNAVHASTGFIPFFVNGLVDPHVPLTPPRCGSELGGGGLADRLADVSPVAVRKLVDAFVFSRLSVMRQVRDAMAESQDLQKENADAKGRSNME